MLLTEFPLQTILGRSAQAKMRQAYKIGMEVPWIRKAEGVIASRLSTVPFTIEDQVDETIDDDYPNANAVAAFDLISKPQANLDVGQKLTRSQLWRLTSRHVGLCGNSFWLNDAMNAFGIPDANLYIRPDRMTPEEDANGNLTGWRIDKTAQQPGVAVSLEQVNHFMLEPPDEGHFGPGLVETWLLRAKITTALDQQLSQVLQSGGRITGILSPKSGTIEPGSDTAVQMERDWRTITEQPDAARRLQIVYAPVEFQKTNLNMDELQIVELMKLMRDDGLAFWGVPPTMAGVPSAGGLNSGETRKYDEAALWQGPIHDRLVIFGEMLQDNLLDRFEALLGYAPELVITEPSFDDDAPRYSLLAQATTVALTDDERRDLIGKPPLPNGLGNVVRLPINVAEVFTVPPEKPVSVTVAPVGLSVPELTEGNSASLSLAAGETTQGKARTDSLRTSLVSLRERLQNTVTPRLRETLRAFLDAQKADIVAKLTDNATHVRQNPRDTSVWFDKAKWDRELRNVLGLPLSAVATTVDAHIASTLAPVKAMDPVDRMLTRGAARITKINETTRDAVAQVLAQAIEDGGTIQDAITALGAAAPFDEVRAELIARTELMDAYNGAALGAYGDAGVREVQAIDGDQDEECAARDGRVFSVEDADGIEDHPNGTLDWVPVLEPVKALTIFEPIRFVAPIESPQVSHAVETYLASRERELAEREAAVIAKADLDAETAALERAQAREQYAAMASQLAAIAQQALAPREAPQVTVNVPEQAPPVVNVAVPPVVVPPAVVTVNVPERKPVTRKVRRDRDGLITEVVET